jgi:iron complex outermembrane receptor protein
VLHSTFIEAWILKRASLICCVLGSTHVSAVDMEGESAFFDQLPTVISASRLNQSLLKTPSAMTVLDREMIEASGFTNLADLFRLVPGFQVAQVDGRRFSVNYHGGGWEYSNRIQVLVNGRSTYAATLSAVDWDTIGVHIKDIDRIEVVRGPAASAYGSNSFTAAINIITPPIILDDDLTAEVRVGSQQDRELLIRGTELWEDHRLRVSAWHRQDNGFDGQPDHRFFNNLSMVYESEFDNRALMLSGHYVSGHTGTDVDLFYGKRNREVEAASTQLRYEQTIDTEREWQINAYHNYDSNDDRVLSPYLAGLFGLTEDQFESLFGVPDQQITLGRTIFNSHKTDVEYQYSGVHTSGLQYMWGLGARYETYKSRFLVKSGEVDSFTYRALGNTQLPLSSSWTLNAGALWEYEQDEDQYVSPRLALNWQFSDVQSFRLAYSRAYRLPSILERNFDMHSRLSNGLLFDQRILADPNLTAEEVSNIELGWVGKLRNHPVQWDLKLYHQKIDDSIGYVFDQTVDHPSGLNSRKLTNTGYYIAQGVEGELTWRPKKETFVRFFFNVGRDKEHVARRAVEPLKIITRTDLSPRNSYGLMYSQPVRDWHVNVAAYHVDDIVWKSRGDHVDGYDRVDLNLRKRFSIAQGQYLDLTFGAQSIGNEYHEFSDNLIYEPRYYVSLSITNP